jgi:hypothetical protein
VSTVEEDLCQDWSLSDVFWVIVEFMLYLIGDCPIPIWVKRNYPIKEVSLTVFPSIHKQVDYMRLEDIKLLKYLLQCSLTPCTDAKR